MEGVVNVVPVPSEDPPVAAAYQLIVPADAVAPSVTVPVEHLLAGVVAEIVGIALITALAAVLEVEVQDPLVAST